FFGVPSGHVQADFRDNDLSGLLLDAGYFRQVHSTNPMKLALEAGGRGFQDGAIRKLREMLSNACIALGDFALSEAESRATRREKSNSSRQLPCRLLATVSRAALMRGVHSVASLAGSCSPARIASRMRIPLSPTMSLITLLNCTFISKSAFCMWWTL